MGNKTKVMKKDMQKVFSLGDLGDVILTPHTVLGCF